MASNNNNQVLLTGLSLIQDSPFKSSQSPNPNQHNTITFSPASPTLDQYGDQNFSSLLNFLKNDYNEHVHNNAIINANPGASEEVDGNFDLNYLNDSYKFYLSELSNTLMNNETVGTPSNVSAGSDETKSEFAQTQDKNSNNFANLKDIKLSDDIKTLFNITKSSNTNDLILKILIENSLCNLNQYLDSKDELDFIQASLKNPKYISSFSKTNSSGRGESRNHSTILSLDEIKALKVKILLLYDEKNKAQRSVSETMESLKEVLKKYSDLDDSNLNNSTYKPSSRQSRIEIENINSINNKLERQLIGTSLHKYLDGTESLKQLGKEIEICTKKLFSHFFTCLIIGYINNITVNLKLQKNLQSDRLSPCTTPKSATTFAESLFKSPILDYHHPHNNTSNAIRGSPLLSRKSSSLQMVENKTAIFNKSIDEIVSHVASIAVQKDIPLPDPLDKRKSIIVGPGSINTTVFSTNSANTGNGISSKTAWVKSCINAILTHDSEKLSQEVNLRENVHLRSNGASKHSRDVNGNDSLNSDISPTSSETSVTSIDFSPNKVMHSAGLSGKLNSPIVGSKMHDSPFNSRSSSSNNTGTNSKEINDLKTKLKDLKFANDYLTKQFKTERESFNKILAEQNMIKLNLEKKLMNSIQNLEKTNALLMQNETTNQDLERKLDENFQTINKLKKKVTDLQIESLGANSPQKLNRLDSGVDRLTEHQNDSTISFSPGSKGDEHEPPYGLLPGLSNEQGVTHHEFSSTSSLLTDATGNSNAGGGVAGMSGIGTYSGVTASPSVGIMRKEFKKIIDDINNKHYIELSNEITERKRLENLVKMYKEKMARE